MCDPVVTPYLLGAALVGQVAQADAARKAQNSASDQATKAAQATADAQDQANNRANAKSPNVAGIMSAAQAKAGAGSTMLTGPQGVDPSALLLGRTTLLGA